MYTIPKVLFVGITAAAGVWTTATDTETASPIQSYDNVQIIEQHIIETASAQASLPTDEQLEFASLTKEYNDALKEVDQQYQSTLKQMNELEAQAVDLQNQLRAVRIQEALREASIYINPDDLYCLAQNIYYEARNQNHEGHIAVAQVVLNRVRSDRFPNTICGVVYQGKRDARGNMIRNKCQFSWYCDGKSDIPRNAKNNPEWESAQNLARQILTHKIHLPVLAEATYYHANYVRPFWASKFNQVAIIDDHIFYENPN